MLSASRGDEFFHVVLHDNIHAGRVCCLVAVGLFRRNQREGNQNVSQMFDKVVWTILHITLPSPDDFCCGRENTVGVLKFEKFILYTNWPGILNTSLPYDGHWWKKHHQKKEEMEEEKKEELGRGGRERGGKGEEEEEMEVY